MQCMQGDGSASGSEGEEKAEILSRTEDSDEVSADSDPDDSGVDTEADPEYLQA